MRKPGLLIVAIIWILGIWLPGIWLTGCSATPSEHYAMTAAVPGGESGNIRHSAEMALEVNALPAAVQSVQSWVQGAGGYIESQHYHSERNARVLCKVPAKNRDSFVTQIKTLGDLKSESVQADDLTEDMLNLDAELKNMYKLRNRMKALLEKAQKIDEILDIERELNRIQSRVDYLERLERSQKNAVQYSAITLDLDEKKPATVYGPLGMVVYGLYWAVEKLFVIR